MISPVPRGYCAYLKAAKWVFHAYSWLIQPRKPKACAEISRYRPVTIRCSIQSYPILSSLQTPKDLMEHDRNHYGFPLSSNSPPPSGPNVNMVTTRKNLKNQPEFYLSEIHQKGNLINYYCCLMLELDPVFSWELLLAPIEMWAEKILFNFKQCKQEKAF